MAWAVFGQGKDEINNFSTLNTFSNQSSYQIDYNPQIVLGSQGTTLETKKEQSLKQSSEMKSELTSDLSNTSGINPYVLIGGVLVLGVGGYFLLK